MEVKISSLIFDNFHMIYLFKIQLIWYVRNDEDCLKTLPMGIENISELFVIKPHEAKFWSWGWSL